MTTTRHGDKRLCDCISSCLMGERPPRQETRETPEERKARERDAAAADKDLVTQERQRRGLSGRPAIKGLTAFNVDLCLQLYTMAEMVEIARQHNIKVSGDKYMLCSRLLAAGLLTGQDRH